MKNGKSTLIISAMILMFMVVSAQAVQRLVLLEHETSTG